MAAASTTDSRLGDFLASIPDPGTDTVSRLVHTLACFAGASDDRALVTTNSGVLRLADLRALVTDAAPTRRAAAIAALNGVVAGRAGGDDEFVVTATVGVYGPGRSGLTWADLQALAGV